MPETIDPDLAAQVLALNDPHAPYVYAIDGTEVVGRWNFDDPALADGLGDGGASSAFRYIVALDPATRTFRCTETDAGYNNGQVRAYRGYSRNTSGNLFTLIVWLVQRAGRKRRTGSASPAHRYQQEEPKVPLRTVLERNGWRRKGLVR